jgi:hypothetical protein
VDKSREHPKPAGVAIAKCVARGSPRWAGSACPARSMIGPSASGRASRRTNHLLFRSTKLLRGVEPSLRFRNLDPAVGSQQRAHTPTLRLRSGACPPRIPRVRRAVAQVRRSATSGTPEKLRDRKRTEAGPTKDKRLSGLLQKRRDWAGRIAGSLAYAFLEAESILAASRGPPPPPLAWRMFALEQDSKRLNQKGDSHIWGFVIQDGGWGWGQHDMARPYSQDLRDRVTG